MVLVEKLANELVLYKIFQNCLGTCQFRENYIKKRGQNGQKMPFWPHLGNKIALILSQGPFLNLALS